MKTKKIYIFNNSNKKTRKKNLKNLKNDYYTFVNDNWIKNNISRKSTNSNFFDNLKKNLNKSLLNIVVKNISGEKTKESINVKNVFNSFINSNDKLVKNHFFQMFNKLNEYRNEETNLYPFLCWLTKNGLGGPIIIDVVNDSKNPDCYILSIEEGGTTFDTKIYYDNKDNIKLYTQYLKNIFIEIFGVNNCYNVNNIIEIEKNIINHTLKIEDMIYIKKTYHKLNSSTIKKECEFQLDNYSKCLGFKNTPNHALVENPNFLKNIMKTLNKTWTLNEWNNYWIYQLIKTIIPFHSKLKKETNLFLKKYSISPLDDSPNINALNFTLKIMNTTISKKYLEYFKNDKEIDYCLNIAERIKKVFKKRIEKNNWLSSKTIEKALLKLEKMKITIGYKKKWQEDPNINFLPNDALKNNVMYINWDIENKIKKCNKKVEPNDVWLRNEQNVYDINAYYNNVENELILPNAILNKPFVDLKKNISYNLAHIGTSIAHEMIHGFDDDGCLYNENGKYENWWTKEDKEKYKEKLKEVENEYMNFSKKDNYKIYTKLTLGENIADICGFLLTEDVLQNYLNDKGIYGTKQNEYFKEFYIHYAKQWRSSMNVNSLKQNLNTDLHSISKYRVNCVLARSLKFQEIYNIKSGDNMYYFIGPNKEIW